METKIDLISEAVLMDNMEYMAQFEDGFFDLAVVDPPYGIGEANSKRMISRHYSGKKYKGGNWDNKSETKKYFKELFRISKNQIIWGANHFISKIPYDSSCWIIWDKVRENQDFADCEIAYTSFKKSIKKYTFAWDGFRQGNMKDKEFRIHPTQKPVALYDWIYKNYATAGMKVIDTHLGSGSNRISAYKAGMNFYSCEIDQDYFNDQEKRFANFKSQLNLFY
jgi:site-specific DNA-methyltransferase (adenine-specific)